MNLIIQLVVAVVVFWLIYAYLIPLMPAPFSTFVLVLLVLVVIVYLLRLAGINIP